MSKGLFITGTGTDIGKTYVTGLIVKKLHEAGLRAAYYKVAMSGNVRDAEGYLIPGDAKHVRDMSGIGQSLESMCPYVYETAVSPHLASRLEGHPVQMDVALDGYHALERDYAYITMEGSGGITCPLCHDEQKIFTEDVIHRLNLPVLIVADAGLGTINDVVLTIFYMRAHDLRIQGVLFNNYTPGDVMQEDNRRMCEEMTGIPVLAGIEKGATDLPLEVKALTALYE